MVLLAAVTGIAPYRDLYSLPSSARLDPVSPYLELALVVLLPTAAGYAIIALFRGARWAAEWRRSHAPAPEPEPIERLAANLRRLRAELEDMETRTGVTAKHLRLRALRSAYIDALETACRRLEVPPPLHAGPPGGEHASQAAIYRVEAELRHRGLDVREAASR
jgi:hypothetical protein